jgi:flagellar biosynthetic protein FliQ
MPGTDVGGLLRETMLVTLKLGGPPLLAALAIGIVMSLLQAVTQINEQTVAFVPKVVVILGALLLLGPFMLMTMTDFSHTLFDQVVAVGSR